MVTDISIEIQGRREIFLKWKPPKDTPSNYMLQLHEIKNGKENKMREALQTQLSHIYKLLKSGTEYCCYIYPKYSGKQGNYTASGLVTTPQSMGLSLV